ncbi:MAG: type I restriction enzyme endonuclease domain-containing protein [Verrucomicrobiota bacterium]
MLHIVSVGRPRLPPVTGTPIALRCLSRSLPRGSALRRPRQKIDSAVQSIGDDKLKLIAADLITRVKKSVTIDWTLREDARSRINVMVRRILNKYGYPPSLRKPPS